MKRSALLLLSLCMLLITCSDNDDPIKEIENKDPFITLKKTNIDFSNEGGSEAILIESNVTWTAKSSASWCTVSPTSGNKSTGSITLSAPANEDYDDRSCTVTIEGGGITKTITVKQGENLGLLVTQDRYELSNEESTIKVEVKANVEFEVEINDEWITQVKIRGLATSEIEFKIAKNDTYGNRNGSITIKQKDGVMESTITIFQSQEDAIILSEKDFELTSEAQSIVVELKTNIDYEIIIPEEAKSWVSYIETRALRTETVVLNIAENESNEVRYTNVFIKDKLSNLEETLTITQKGNSYQGNQPDYEVFLEFSYESTILYFNQISILDDLMCNSDNNYRGISPENRLLENAYSKAYQTILRFNIMIEYIENNANIETNPFINTFKVLRAMIYLDMVQHWGDVPFITRPLSYDETNVSRTDKVEIYNALLEDLEGSSNKELFIPQDLVYALTGMIHLELKNYSVAATCFEKAVEKNNMVSTLNPSLDIENIYPLYNKLYMQLNYAESLLGANQPSDLLAILNTIRKEGNMESLQELPKAPAHEIANLWKELIGVKYGYYALLKRLGIAVEILDIYEYQQLYPIPSSELMLNPYMTQNPGY